MKLGGFIMKTRYIFTAILLLTTLSEGYSQEISKKEIKDSKSQIRQQQIEMILNSGIFIFRAGSAIPMGGRLINMTTNPGYVIFNKDNMDGDLPFFGSATTAIGFSGDLAIRFKDKPKSFKTDKRKKSYEVESTVSGNNGTYTLYLSIPFGDGPSTLTVSSNDRSSISYYGQIYELKQPEVHPL